MKIAFCTTCKGRTQHLRRTLPLNITNNPGPDFKFIVLDYNSQDDLLDYLKSDCSAWIASNKLAVYSYREPTPFRMAHAKNMAHRCGMLEGADVLVNLDADNFTERGFAEYLLAQFDKPNIFCWADKIPGKMGISGRIVVSKQSFVNSGGYDERFTAHSPDDMDFNSRLQRMGCTPSAIDPQFLGVILHNDKLRFREYPHANWTNGSRHAEEAAVRSSTKTIANDGWTGCGTVFKNFGAVPTVLKPIPTRIFGIGLHKTATTSLHKALTTLGYNSAHWPSGDWARDIWDEVRTTGKSKTMERSYAVSDLPIGLLYKQLDEAYPGSKFILTVRDEAKWLESVKAHWTYERNPYRWEWDVYPISNRLHQALYGRKTFDAEVFLSAYRRHNAEALDHFKDRQEDLLVMNMDEGAGWNDLCKFLNDPLPSCSYPREMVTA